MAKVLSHSLYTCPRCRIELAPEIVGAFALHRCADCRGVWLDPDAFRAACTAGAPVEDGDATPGVGHSPSRPRADSVSYLRCPICADVMNRVNFARVSGVILDVCRAHGAWFDAGELRAVRRFVRGPGLAGFVRRPKLHAERAPPMPGTGGGAEIDLVDVLAGIPDPWDVPLTRSAARWFLRASVLAVAGAVLVYFGVSGLSRAGFLLTRGDSSGVAVATGVFCAAAAIRAFGRGLARRSAEGSGQR